MVRRSSSGSTTSPWGPQTGEMLHASASLDNIEAVAVVNGQETPIRANEQLLHQSYLIRR